MSLVASRESVDLGQKTLAAEQRRYELGAKEIFLVLEAQTELAQAESTLLAAEINYQLAIAGLEHARGTSLEAYQVSINDLTH